MPMEMMTENRAGLLYDQSWINWKVVSHLLLSAVLTHTFSQSCL